MALRKDLETIFPKLASSPYRVMAAPSTGYNCLAFAAGETHRWWWPEDPLVKGVYWPPGVPLKETVEAFVAAFATLGYVQCHGPELEQGFEKLALYALANGFPTHAARQLPDGWWTSKLGFLDVIEHATLEALEGDAYGKAVKFLKRPRIGS
jgi:hypothetical protein